MTIDEYKASVLWCFLCDHIEVCKWYPTCGCEFRQIGGKPAGRWIFYEQKDGYLWKCSNCKGNFDQMFSFCPYCGAKMT